jgi:hypothetical protein
VASVCAEPAIRPPWIGRSVRTTPSLAGDRCADLHGPPRLAVNVMRARSGRPAHQGYCWSCLNSGLPREGQEAVDAALDRCNRVSRWMIGDPG